MLVALSEGFAPEISDEVGCFEIWSKSVRSMFCSLEGIVTEIAQQVMTEIPQQVFPST